MKFIKSKKILAICILWIFIVLLNLLFWNLKGFSDYYTEVFFPIWVETYGRLTGMFPFSVGEWMLVMGVILVILLPVFLILLPIIKKERFSKFVARYGWFFAWVVTIVALVMTLNCFSLYHTSPLSNPRELASEEEITEENLIGLWNYLAGQANVMAEKVDRESDGKVKTPEWTYLQDKAVEAVMELSYRYPRLEGFYPKPKRLFFSDFMSQQNMEGYYFPFSMEANINDVMYITNKPAALCHELVHLKGYISEDEANFLGFLACIYSDDVLFQYSGYLSVLGYVAQDINNLGDADPTISERYEIVQLTDQVRKDRIFLLEEERNRIEEKAIVSSETVDEMSDAFLDTSLKMNGVEQGVKVYYEVVGLLVRYYAKNWAKLF